MVDPRLGTTHHQGDTLPTVGHHLTEGEEGIEEAGVAGETVTEDGQWRRLGNLIQVPLGWVIFGGCNLCDYLWSCI